MHKEIITACMPIDGIPSRITVLYEQGQPVECYAEQKEAVSDLGWIYQGKIESIQPGISAAFVRISADRQVYLPLTGRWQDLKAGDELPVQIIQEAQKTKLPKATPEWDIAGNYLVLSSVDGGVSFSRRLSGEQKASLQTLAGNWKKDPYHILFRTRAADASEEELKQEYAQLCQTADSIRQKAATRTCYTVLYHSPVLQERLIRRCRAGDLSRFMTDDPELAAVLVDTCRETGTVCIKYEDTQLPLYRLRNLSALLDRLTQKTVPLSSGGSLVIEQTEAFAVIDVNTGRYTGKRDAAETRMKLNREAAEEAARQIRLRQLSGTILIDFINPENTQEETELMNLLQERFCFDPVYTKTVDFTRLHICEITRKKTRRSLAEQIRLLRTSACDANG